MLRVSMAEGFCRTCAKDEDWIGERRPTPSPLRGKEALWTVLDMLTEGDRMKEGKMDSMKV